MIEDTAAHWPSLRTAPGVDRAIVMHVGGRGDSHVILNIDGEATDRINLAKT